MSGRRRRAPWSRALAAVYLALAFAGWVVIPLGLRLAGRGGPLSGALGVLLTMPWSGWAVTVLDGIDPGLVGSWPGNVGVFVVCAGLNAAILYGLAARVEAALAGPGRPPPPGDGA